MLPAAAGAGHTVGVDDAGVVQAFVQDGSEAASGPSLQVEGAILKLEGWWPMAYRISGRTFILRKEDPPVPTSAPADVAAALAARGLREVGTDLPGIALLTYTKLDLGYAPWGLWSTDADAGEADLNATATEESFL